MSAPIVVVECFPNNEVLQLFTLKNQLLFSVDASSKGLGACLTQEAKPAVYTSRSLTQT